MNLRRLFGHIELILKRNYRTMTAADLLNVVEAKQTSAILYISKHRSIFDALTRMADRDVAGLVVVDEKKHVVGMMTQTDILKRIVQRGKTDWDGLVSEIATPAKAIIHVSPTDTIEDCRAVMALSGRRELPVLSGTKLLGVISITDIATLLYKMDSEETKQSSSAKADYITMILPRRGLPTNTSLLENRRSRYLSEDRKKKYQLLSAAVSFPSPNKEKVGRKGEDAYFLGTSFKVEESSTSDEAARVNYIGVADGVGSWLEHGIDAGKYSRMLMAEALRAVQSDKTSLFLHPVDILTAAWHSVIQNAVIGSSTACILALDGEQGELHAANLGDSGFVIIRDKESDQQSVHMRGTLDGSLSRLIRNPVTDLTPAGRRKGAHISYRSPQQLHNFNCPYQIGHLEKGDENSLTFDRPTDSLLLRVPVLEGDLIILATDGLFDNLDEDKLLEIVSTESDVTLLAHKVASEARKLSLDQTIDSPFARLAKENDLLWGGGIPDDITVIASRVVTSIA